MIIFMIPISLSIICILSLSRCYFMDAFPPLDCWKEKEIPAFLGNMCNTIQTICLRKTNKSFRDLHRHMDTRTHIIYMMVISCVRCAHCAPHSGPHLITNLDSPHTENLANMCTCACVFKRNSTYQHIQKGAFH